MALAFLVYRPGLSGGFLFDDFVNLNAIGATGRVDDWPAFWRFITSGTADPTGRPLSLLTFLIDANAWPADARPFLRTNVLLHLVNGVLLFVLLRQLGRHVRTAHADAAALLGAALWTLHPLFVSTTLYVVQREAMLPATFTLLGLIAWVHGADRIGVSRRAGIGWMCVAIGVFTPLATLSKANGMLLPLLAWTLDATLLRKDMPQAAAATHRRLRLALLIAPAIAIFAYLALQALHPFDQVPGRAWSVAERLLTQPRVLCDYLFSLVVPRTLTTGLYNDGYVASRGLLQPASTLFALLAVAALLAAAFAWRRRAPALSAALLFFFAGHVLESTVIPLELYFEHRNYLPAMLLGWPLALAIVGLRLSVGARAAIALSLVALLSAITIQRTTLWAQQERMAWLWAAQNPGSPRAQATAAIFETNSGRADLAVQRLVQRASEHPDDLQLVLNLASARCGAGGLSPADIEQVAMALRTATLGDQLVHRWLARTLDVARNGGCRGLDVDVIDDWVAASLENPKLRSIPGRMQDIHSLKGRIAIARGDAQGALREFDLAFAASPSLQAAAGQAAMLASAGCHREALQHLDASARVPQASATASLSMGRVHALVLKRQHFWPGQIAGLRTQIAADLDRDGNTQCMQ